MACSSPADHPLPRTRGALLLRPDLWLAVLRAGGELAWARYRLARCETRELLQAPAPRLHHRPRHHQAALVAWAIPRVAARVPWRADCLVQALAARRWLHGCGVDSELYLGTRKDRPAGFEAHAWLCVEGRVVTGGDISGFVPLLTPTTGRGLTGER